MELLPYFLAFSAICGLLSYGFQRRPAWMWHLGWVIQYIMAGWIGWMVFESLRAAETTGQIVSACIYSLGGLVIWLPASVWWSNHRHWFGKQKTRPKKGPLSPQSPPPSNS